MNYDPSAIEQFSLRFWQEKRVYEQVKEKNAGKKKFFFLEGPPYTSGNIHIGHAWNIAMKDIALRYQRMKGKDVFDRWGYDMHGLPTENKVQKKLNLKAKEDIEVYGVDKFIAECRSFAEDTAKVMNEDFKKLGAWMDFDNAYMPITSEFISAEWMLIKKAHESGRLYKGKKSMTWDKATETAHAKHELEYKTIKDPAIYVKFKAENGDYFIIWTTTPWTIPFNMAIMVNPDIMYARVEVGGETWILAQDLVETVLEKARKEGTVKETFLGKELEGKKYEHFFAMPFPESERTHTVVLTKEHVDTKAGTGLVHSAPGCGTEDFEVGQEYNIPPFNTVDERGIFQESGEFTGLIAKDDDQTFIEKIKEKQALVAKEMYEHEYPHSWRSHEPVIFRVTDQWFLKTEDLRETLLKQNEATHWVPKQTKESFERWVSNLRDNAITRQRYWGCPVPIWEDDEGNIEVIGSLEELKEKAIAEVPEDLHRPFIDAVKIKGKNGKEMTRVPDVLDVWLDSGTVSWNALNYPQETETLEKFFPADLIVEATEQARLWFTMLHICGAIVFDTTPFKNVYSHGMINDYEGEKMSKSLGNVISPKEVTDKHGADILRYYMAETKAGKDINFSWDEVTLKQRNMMVLWNVMNYILDLEKQVSEGDVAEPQEEERYIVSKVHSTMKAVTEAYESYQLDTPITHIETLFLDVSRTYIQLVREKAVMGSDEEKRLVFSTLKDAFFNILKMFSPTCPLTMEYMYQQTKHLYGKEESIHLCAWPEYTEELIDEKLEHDMKRFGEILQAGLAAREKASISLRWPVQEIIVAGSDAVQGTAATFETLLKKQLNTKSIVAKEEVEGMNVQVKINYKEAGKKFGSSLPQVINHLNGTSQKTMYQHIQEEGMYVFAVDGKEYEVTADDVVFETSAPEGYEEADFSEGAVFLNTSRTKALELEGFSREIMRSIQQLRKEKGLEKHETIKLHIQTDFVEVDFYSEHIKDKCGCSSLTISDIASEMEEQGKTEIKNKNFRFYWQKQ